MSSEGLAPLEIDALLAGFRDWLVRTVAATAAVSPPLPIAAEPPDLHSLLGQLIALKQEVNLQTRTTRSQQEQNAESLRQLADALRALDETRQQAEEAAAEAAEARAESEVERERAEQLERLRPLLKAMVDVHDALALARREVQRIHESLTSEPEWNAGQPAAPADMPPPRLSWLAQWLGVSDALKKYQEEAAQFARLAQEREAALLAAIARQRSQVRRLVDSIVTGYAMSLERLERVLEQHGLEAIPCLGEPFDPETMEVVEVVDDPGRSASEVVEEVRRGYFWQGRVFRFAQVKVARGGSTPPETSEAATAL